jgi:deltex-like protein
MEPMGEKIRKLGTDAVRDGDMPRSHASHKGEETLYYLAVFQQMDGDEELARRIQAEEEQKDLCDAAELAAAILREEESALTKRLSKEEEMFGATPAGRAWKLVEHVVQLQASMCGDHEAQNYGNIQSIAVDDIVFLAERFIAKQKEFVSMSKPRNVVVGYHYTYEENLDGICQDGLISVAQQHLRQVSPRRGSGGAVYFGTGICKYICCSKPLSLHLVRVSLLHPPDTANNPHAFVAYGRIGLLVAVLPGMTKRVHQGGLDFDDTVDSGIGNKTVADAATRDVKEMLFNDEIVLRDASQCLPLFSYPSEMARSLPPDSPGAEQLWLFHQKLQQLLDTFFNRGRATTLQRILPTISPPNALPIPRSSSMHMPVSRPVAVAVPYQMRSSSLSPVRNHLDIPNSPIHRLLEKIVYVAPNELRHNLAGSVQSVRFDYSQAASTVCMVCMSDFVFGNAIKILKCDHVFHSFCLESSSKYCNRCPACRVSIGEPQGPSPSGTMTISASDRILGGCEHTSSGSFQIRYDMQGGTQKSYHCNPGVAYKGTHRVAFLPDNNEGRALLRRLKYAFQHGLTFSIGTSMTTGLSNSIVWASIHHKTSCYGGDHGFPDSNFVANCNRELDSLAVPEAKCL